MADLRKIPTFEVKTNSQVVEQLEKLLQKAKEGKISEFTMLYKTNEGVFTSYWTGTSSVLALIGQLQFMVHEQCKRLDGSNAED